MLPGPFEYHWLEQLGNLGSNRDTICVSVPILARHRCYLMRCIELHLIIHEEIHVMSLTYMANFSDLSIAHFVL